MGCPYCNGDTFENAATQESETQWINKCKGCGKYSMYDEATDEQTALDEPRKSNG